MRQANQAIQDIETGKTRYRYVLNEDLAIGMFCLSTIVQCEQHWWSGIQVFIVWCNCTVIAAMIEIHNAMDSSSNNTEKLPLGV